MPRSHSSAHQWRALFAAAISIALILCTGFQASAQKKRRGKPAAQTTTQQTDSNSNSATTPPAAQRQPQKKNLAALRGSDTPEGGRATITSDAPLNDYEAYRSGNRYYVVIPQANAPGGASNLRGRGFDDVQVHKRGNDTVLSFRLKPGATAHVNQKFNRLEVVFNTPGDASSTPTTTASPSGTTAAQNGNTNSRTGTSTTGATTTAGANSNNANSAQSGTASSTTAGVTPPTTAASPGDATLPAITPGLGPTVEASPVAAASPTPPADQVAQSQPAPSVPTAVTTTTTTTPGASGTSLGTVLKNNWLLVLIAALLLISIGLVAMTRSRARRSETEPLPLSDKETPALEAGTTAKAEARRLDEATVAAGAVGVVKTVDRPVAVAPVALADETETLEVERAAALDVERVRLEIKHLLTGQEYDESVINAPVKETRQLIESELLFALSKRHTDRRDRALKAFTQHGYFDDATRDLRTAEVPAERAAAARKLGLTRDTVATPHLVVALEDTTPEVRRAAIEALTELRDPAAVGPLESLLERDEDRKVPHALIERAIKASATGTVAVKAGTPAAPAVEAAPHEEALTVEAPPAEEVAPPVLEAEAASPLAEATNLAAEALTPGVLAASLASAPASLDEETQEQRVEAEPAIVDASLQGADIAPVEAATEATTPARALESVVVEGIVTAEAGAAERHRAKADAARIHAETERLRVEEEARRKEEAERQRVEAEAQRQREEAEAERLRTEEEARRREEEERVRAEEERRRAEEESRRLAEEERLRAEEESRRVAEQARLEEEARLKAAEEERLRAEETRRQRAEEREQRRRAEEEKARLEVQERERAEADAARRRAEDAALRLAEMRRRAEEEARQREEAEAARLLQEEEARRAEEEAERERVEREEAEARQREEEEELERQRVAQEALRKEEESERLRVEQEAERERVEAEAQRQREEAEAERLRTEEEARRREEEERIRAEEERRRAEEESRRLAEEERLRAEAEAARIQFEQEAAERRRREEAAAEAAKYAEVKEIEPSYNDADAPTTQPELFELTLDPEQPVAVSSRETSREIIERHDASDWMAVDFNEAETVREVEPSVLAAPSVLEEAAIIEHNGAEALPVENVEAATHASQVKEIELAGIDLGGARVEDDFASVPGGIMRRLSSEIASERAAAVTDLVRVGGDDSFREISAAFDDPAQLVRDAAARALFDLHDDHASSFTRALREAPPDRRRRIGNALASSGLANDAIGHLMGESREKTYDAFSLLFLMSKAGEVQPLMRAIEEHPSSEVRLAVVKLLALSGQQDILPAFRRLAVRGSLPTEVRSAVMEAIYQISSQSSSDTTHVA